MKTLKSGVTRSLLGLFVIVCLGNACSTPLVPTTDTDPPDTAWWAYQDCLDNLPRGSSASVCNNVGTTRAQTPQSYAAGNLGSNVGPYPASAYPQSSTAYTYNTGSSAGSTGPLGTYSTTSASKAVAARAVASDPVQLGNAIAYREYLKTLDEATLKEMTDQWKALKAQAAE